MLTERRLNRAVLARQMLLGRARCSIPEALERMGGLQAQYAPSAYVGLWSRLERFERSDLNQALEDRRVVQGTLMRVTIHLVSASDYFLFAEAVREPRRAWWLQATKRARTEEEMPELADRTRDLLSDGPRNDRSCSPPWGSTIRLWSASACGSTCCGCRPRVPGSAGGRISTPWRTTGSRPRTPRLRRVPIT
jgi:hypothetical protein